MAFGALSPGFESRYPDYMINITYNTDKFRYEAWNESSLFSILTEKDILLGYFKPHEILKYWIRAVGADI
jgi:hypothetical protein